MDELDQLLKKLGLSVARGVPQLATGFIDLLGLPLTLTGMQRPQDIVGSTAYLTERGFLPPPQTGLLNETAELISSAVSPAGLAKTSAGLLTAGMIPVVKKQIDNLPVASAMTKKEASNDRLKRAEKLGFKKDVYHGTYSDFSEFDRQNDLGVHVGTPEQAYNRLIDIEKYKTFKGTRGGVEVGQGGQIMPLKAKIKKSLNMKDVGDWKNPYEVLLHLRSTPLGKKYQTKFDEIEDEMTPIIESFIYGEENWTDSIEAAGYMDELRDIIGKEGYDSIKYVNEVENTYGSLAGLTPKGKKEKERLQKEVKKINDEVGKRDQELVPKLGASAEEIEKFNKTNPTTITPEEVKKREQLILQIREVEKNEVYDPHSYIILNPKQLRSINADFDPEKIEELDILSQLQRLSKGLA